MVSTGYETMTAGIPLRAILYQMSYDGSQLGAGQFVGLLYTFLCPLFSEPITSDAGRAALIQIVM